tara:strand:- start:237 stop:677 length:441 start_codon:yes stop_codon:yes gene_type:complete
MLQSKEKPYVLYVAEIIYTKICEIKKENLDFSSTDAIKKFIGSDLYKEISDGKFHEQWFENLEKDNYIDKKTNNKIPEETLKLLRVQKDMMMKQLIQFPDLYYTKNNIPLEISQRAFDHLWRICESYELWCKETDQNNLLILNIID